VIGGKEYKKISFKVKEGQGLPYYIGLGGQEFTVEKNLSILFNGVRSRNVPLSVPRVKYRYRYLRVQYLLIPVQTNSE